MPVAFISKETGRSTPFRSSFSPLSRVTKRGALMRVRLSAAESSFSNTVFKNLTAFSVSISVSLD